MAFDQSNSVKRGHQVADASAMTRNRTGRPLNEKALGRLHSPEGRAALRSLTPPERLLCESLFERQFSTQRVDRDLAKYGLDGTVQLGSANAFRVYEFILVWPIIICAVAGLTAAAGALFAIMFAVFLVVVARVYSSSRTGKRWRANQANAI